jgi:hypothetical protein
MPQPAINLFAILNDPQSIKRIPLTADVQTEVIRYLTRQKEIFIDPECEQIEFTGDYTAEVGEIYKIPNYEMSDDILAAINNPISCGVLNLNDENISLKCLFFGPRVENNGYIAFQVFDSRRILKRGVTLINSRETYSKLEEPGMTLQDRITALFVDGNLYFISYANTRKFLSLTEYYREATDAEIDEFIDNEMFLITNRELFKTNSNQIVRKRIALLKRNSVLDNVTIPNIRRVGREYGVAINIREGKIVLPTSRKEIKELVKLLDEDYFTAPLTGRKCTTNSKRYIT